MLKGRRPMPGFVEISADCKNAKATDYDTLHIALL
jgi:hypothetical protein